MISAIAPDLGRGVTPLGHRPLGMGSSRLLRLTSDLGWLLLDCKRSVFIPIPKKDNAKECSNYRTIALFPHASKVMLKFRQATLQQYVNRELPDVQLSFYLSSISDPLLAHIWASS